MTERPTAFQVLRLGIRMRLIGAGRERNHSRFSITRSATVLMPRTFPAGLTGRRATTS